MNTNFKLFSTFVLGGAVGSILTYFYITNKYNKLIGAELNREPSPKNEPTDISDNQYKSDDDTGYIDPIKYKKTVKHNESVNKVDYTSYSKKIIPATEPTTNQIQDEEKPIMKNKDNLDKKPYVIPPDRVGENEEYDVISLTYYADKVLTDEDNRRIKDVEGSVGEESLNTFGQYEDDSVFVCNDRLKTYYEILLDLQNYEDVITKKPHRAFDD